jgi:hypothetical protein
MRARATWFVVGAVMALGVVAVLDALPWPGGEVTRARQAELQAPGKPPSNRLDAEGVLFYTDNFCRLRGLELPSLEAVEAPEWEDCGFSLSPDSGAVLPQGVTWEPQGDTRVAGFDGFVHVVSDAGGWEYRLRGQTPAFKPNGSLTFVRDRAVLELTGACGSQRRAPGCEHVLLTSDDLFGTLADGGEAPAIKEIVWLTPTRMAAVLAFDQEDMIGFYEGRELVELVPGIGGRFTALSVSPGRHYVAAHVARPSGFMFVDRDGRPFALMEVRRDNFGRPPFTAGKAVAWSPDDAWTVVARRESVIFFRMGSESPHVVTVGVTAHDLAWAPGNDVRDPAPDHLSSS